MKHLDGAESLNVKNKNYCHQQLYKIRLKACVTPSHIC